jgi:ABC-type nitrate/sulfonate/bicarbonate transport system permease component
MEHLIEPVVDLLRPIPSLAFMPMFIIWFGLGELSKILMIAYSCFFIVFVNAFQGVRYVDPTLIRAARSLGATRSQIFFTIILPAASPEIITGLRLGMGMAFFVIVGAELIGASSGIGFRIMEARSLYRVDEMFFGAAEIGVLGYCLAALLKLAENRLLAWKPQSEEARQ